MLLLSQCVSVFLQPPDDQLATMSSLMFPVFCLMSPLVLSSPLLVEESGLMGCQCSPAATTRVELRGGGHLLILI